MRSCLQKGCVRLGKVIRPPGSIATCRLSRPEMPTSGPRPREVPGRAGCVCVQEERAGCWPSCACWPVWIHMPEPNGNSMCMIHCAVLSGLLLPPGAAESTVLIRLHSSQLTQKPPPFPAAGGRARDWATEKQRMDFSIRLALPGPWLLQGPFPESQYPIPTHHFFWIPESRCQRTHSHRAAVTLGRPLFPTCREQP